MDYKTKDERLEKKKVKTAEKDNAVLSRTFRGSTATKLKPASRIRKTHVPAPAGDVSLQSTATAMCPGREQKATQDVASDQYEQVEPSTGVAAVEPSHVRGSFRPDSGNHEARPALDNSSTGIQFADRLASCSDTRGGATQVASTRTARTCNRRA